MNVIAASGEKELTESYNEVLEKKKSLMIGCILLCVLG